QDRHEPRGRKPNDQLPPSRAREVQRAFRLRRAEHLAALEERIMILEGENTQLRALLSLPEADRPKIGSGPTGRGKSLKEGGVPMSERVRARKEARARERSARGLPPAEDGETDSDSAGMTSPGVGVNMTGNASNTPNGSGNVRPVATNTATPTGALPLFSPPTDLPAPYNFNLPTPFQLPISPEPQFNFTGGNQDTNNSFPAAMFSMFDIQTQQNSQTDTSNNNNNNNNNNLHNHNHNHNSNNTNPAQPDLLTRLKACCHLSDSHVVNDPGLLIFATRLCQSFACPFGGSHPDSAPVDDPEQMLLEDAWRALKATLDPGGDADGENRINTGRMAAELVVRAAASRGNGNWIICRYKEGMTVKRTLIGALVQGFGGKLD
ncbi:hypothetical protein CC85DRAFT_240336, partial [Cutaneotrichosporon oleaginosum]